MKPLIAGNWKMNGTAASGREFDLMTSGYDADLQARCDLLVCPPATLLGAFRMRAGGTGVRLGGQDCHVKPCGAHTGDISAEMLRDAGAEFVIVGHSERRSDHGESDPVVKAKAMAARRAGLVAVLCIGETADERRGGRTLAVIVDQLEGSLPDEATPETLVVAYEPVWAIGSGLTPTVDDVAEVHDLIRGKLVDRYGATIGDKIRILYGGSVKPSNAAELLAVENVDGALVGGASLTAADFLAIAAAAPRG